MSGAWEWLITSVTQPMKAVIGSQSALVDLEVLLTVFAEVTSILNGSSSSDNPNDMEPLTPNHPLL